MPRKSNIKLRRGSQSAWSSTNPILDDGEPGYESTNRTIKIGDSLNYWGDLPEAILSVNPSTASGASKFYSLILSSPLVNFKSTGDLDIFTVPSGYMFFIDRMEVVTTAITSAGSAPYIRFGKTGSLATFLSAVESQSNSSGARHIFDSPQQGTSSTTVTFGVTAASTALEHKGYGIVRGYLVRSTAPGTTAPP